MPPREEIRRAAETTWPVCDVQTGRDDLKFQACGTEFQCDLWHLPRVEEYLAAWPAFTVGWPWDHLCEQLPDALFVAGERNLFERLRMTVSQPPAALKQTLFAGQLEACRVCLKRMSQACADDDPVAFFAALHARSEGWTWHWAKCPVHRAHDRFVDVPQAADPENRRDEGDATGCCRTAARCPASRPGSARHGNHPADVCRPDGPDPIVKARTLGAPLP